MDRKDPLSMRFSRQGYWSGLPLPSPGDLPDLGTGPGPPALQARSLLLSHQGSPEMLTTGGLQSGAGRGG